MLLWFCHLFLTNSVMSITNTDDNCLFSNRDLISWNSSTKVNSSNSQVDYPSNIMEQLESWEIGGFDAIDLWDNMLKQVISTRTIVRDIFPELFQ